MTESTPHAATATRQILASSFSTPDGASKSAGAVVSANLGKVGNTAVLYVRSDGTPKFIESRDWGARIRPACR